MPDGHPVPDLPDRAYRTLTESDGQNFSQLVQLLRRSDDDQEATHFTKVLFKRINKVLRLF